MKEKSLENNKNIVVATPSYDGKFFENYVCSLLEYSTLSNTKINVDFLSGDSLVPRSRNYLISRYYHNFKKQKYDYILWQDADVYIPKHGLLSMLNRNVDVVAAPVPLKYEKNYYYSEHGMIQSIVGVYEEVEPYFYKAKYAATGALMLSTKVVEKLVEYCKEKNLLFSHEREETVYDVFQTYVDENNFYLSEDWHLCKILKKLGFEIHIDSSFFVSHMNAVNSYWQRPKSLLSSVVLENNKNNIENKERWVTNDVFLSKNFLDQI
jgi:hypothetical protein